MNKIKVSVSKLLELVKSKAAQDEAEYRAAQAQYECDHTKWLDDTAEALNEIAARVLAGDSRTLDALKRLSSYDYERIGIKLPPYAPAKPNHTSSIRQLELAADEVISIEAGSGLGRYLS